MLTSHLYRGLAMYGYVYDEETGGILLTSTELPPNSSKEPRPVYSQEMDILGFGKHFTYLKSDKYPYMWYENRHYIYRGKEIAKTKGGSFFMPPTLEITDEGKKVALYPLKFVDIKKTVEKNSDILESLFQNTCKKLYREIYLKYKDKVDLFYVAFSGGKDSVVLLDIVKKTLPIGSFKVLFGDTQMEFPDTYKTVELIKKQCQEDKIDFITAKSHLDPNYTWNAIGPPATIHRWCCSIHKTVPQILALRQVTGKVNFRGIAFIGVRASESFSRSEYEYLGFGEKHKGQYTCSPILDWNSAELYLYIYKSNLILGDSYKKGNSRAGCLVCPAQDKHGDFTRHSFYKCECENYLQILKDVYKERFTVEKNLIDFIENRGWKDRKHGKDFSYKLGYSEKIENNKLILEIENPRTDWKEWIKTAGTLLNDESPYLIKSFNNKNYEFEILENKNGYSVIIEDLSKKNAVFYKVFKYAFRRAVSCIGCNTCEANCPFGYIKFDNNQVKIDDRCVKCHRCCELDSGCLVYTSLYKPKEKKIMKNNPNRYSSHGPKKEWIDEFFKYKNDFLENHSLGSGMISKFKTFLKDSKLSDEKYHFSKTAELIEKIGLKNEISWAILFVNLSFTPQINWFVKNVGFDKTYSRDEIINKLFNVINIEEKEQKKVNNITSKIFSSLSRFCGLPFSNVGMGTMGKEKSTNISITRTPWATPDPRVILYAIYKYSESVESLRNFNMSTLIDSNEDVEGANIGEIFGIDRETFKKMLNGMSSNYPEFINASFTHDLNSIVLREGKTSDDVLQLF